jgi:hypothetical protein
MKKKNLNLLITFHKSISRQQNLLSYFRVDTNSKLKRKNYGRELQGRIIF